MTGSRKDHLVYFIGAGPGAPGYLTLDGLRALESSPTVYAIDPYPETFSGHLAGKDVRDPFDRVFAEISGEVEEALEAGSVSFLIPGDLTVFSPFLPLVEHFGNRAKVIAGVGVVNAAAAMLGRTLDMPAVSHTIVMTSPKHIAKSGEEGQLARLAALGGTMVLYMNNRPLEELTGELAREYGEDTAVAIAYRIGLEGEKLYRGNLATIADKVGDDDIFGLESGEPSMGLIIVGDILDAEPKPAFWDKRKKKFWDRSASKSKV
jgi:precorrin-4/cobalt-precorrin-4 C11-methyltransferase